MKIHPSKHFALGLFAAALSFSISLSARAHPVAFDGAWSLMGSFGDKEQELSLSRTWLPPGIAPGLHYRRAEIDAGPIESVSAHLNALAKRWNFDRSQANIYVSVSVAHETLASRNAIGLGGAVEADWEDRRLYGSAKFVASRLGAGSPANEFRLRAGFAPYLAEFDQLHSWLIFEWKRDERMSRAPVITPFVRLFYQNFLMELGVPVGGGFHMNWMAHL